MSEPIYACDRCGDRKGWWAIRVYGQDPFLREDGGPRVCAIMGDGTPNSVCWGRYRLVQPGDLTGAELIAAERRRQIEAEGWTPEHDDRHAGGELVHAARIYAAIGIAVMRYGPGWAEVERRPPMEWPWDAEWWKPSGDPIRNLVKAGALIAAEIDRLQRAAEKEVGS